MFNIPKVLITGGFAVLSSLSAVAADMSVQADTPAATGRGVSAEQKSGIQGDTRRINRRKQMREHWERMSPKEREEVRKKMKDHWNSMSPEEREASRKEMREHFKNMSPEERQQFKSDMDKRDVTPAGDDDYPGGKADNDAASQVRG